jgi:hypothetical protein
MKKNDFLISLFLNYSPPLSSFTFLIMSSAPSAPSVSVIDKCLYNIHEQYSYLNEYDFSIPDEDDVIELSSEMANSFTIKILKEIVNEFGKEKIKNLYLEKSMLPKKSKRFIQFVSEILMETYFLSYYQLFGNGKYKMLFN